MKIGLIGKKLSHSYSQFIHENLYIKPYHLITINHIEEVFNHDLDAFNITNPFKEQIINHLVECDDISKATQTVNTVIKKDNQYYGFNTDYDGFQAMMKHYRVDFDDKKVIILGNGASSRTVEHYLKQERVQSLTKLVRHPRSDQEDLLRNQRHYRDTQIIINTTPVGMSPHVNDKLLINFHNFPECELVIDLIYNPFRTTLLIEAEKFNIPTINGLYMLLMQAKRAEELILNQSISMSLIKEIHHQIIHNHVNIVLIGLPLSGKSTYGKLLGVNLGKEWIDTDEKIEEYSKLKVSQIFKLSGESKFREIEQYVIQSMVHKQGKIISCGGGVVLNHKNIEHLKRNGLIVYIDKDIDMIEHDNFESRPLLDSLEDLKNLSIKRNELYKQAADIHFVINKNHPFNLERLKAVIYEYFDH